jgi:N-acetylmuramoyl-L-alanine amidase
MDLAAGLPFVRLNGTTHPLAEAPRFRGGVLQIPAAAARLLAPAGARPAPPLRGVVVLDAGHGGRDPGAEAHGLREKDLALDIVRRTARRLRERGVEVILTREGDTFLDLADRPDDANRRPGALFVSVHLNAVGGANRATARGVETFILAPSVSEAYRLRQAARRYDVPDAARRSRAARAESLALARAVQAALVGKLGEVDRKVKVKNFAVLRECYFGPAILAEVGFLTHPETARKLRTAAHRDRIAEALAEGIARHLSGTD